MQSAHLVLNIGKEACTLCAGLQKAGWDLPQGQHGSACKNVLPDLAHQVAMQLCRDALQIMYRLLSLSALLQIAQQGCMSR